MIGPNQSQMQETVLPNGVRVFTERIPAVRSVSVGAWVRQGAAHESLEVMGASHLLEHLVFKGTRRRDPREIALALERLGGSLDAFTSREHTSFQARVLPENVDRALDVLADLILDPLLRAEDLELERQVVLEEISTVDDTPDDLVFELHGEALWQGHPYGRSILGTRQTVGALGVDVLRDLHGKRYRRGEILVAAAGFLDHEEFVDQVAGLFGAVEPEPSPEVPEVSLETPSDEVQITRDSAQTHIVFGSRVPPRGHRARFPLVLLSAAFGGGMGSRLFQRIREELALAYTVYSFQSFYSRGGVSGVYVGTRPDWADRAVDAVREELRAISSHGLDDQELREVKDQVKGQVMLSLESTQSRLFRLAGFPLYGLRYLNLDELLETIERVTPDEVKEAAGLYFDPDVQVVLRLGPDGV